MDAVTPRRGTAADYRSHPRSVYHLFDRLGYGIVDVAVGRGALPAAHLPRRAHARGPGC